MSSNNRRIDTHHHIVPVFYAEAIKETGGDPSGWSTPSWSEEFQKEAMSKLGIETAIISITAPGALIYSGEKARVFARKLNDYTSNLVMKDSQSLGFFASLPSLTDVDGALAEIEYASETLKCDGFIVYTSYKVQGQHYYLGNEVFKPIWEKLDSLSSIVFIHPNEGPSPILREALPQPVIDYPHETTRTAADLLLSGTKSSFPNIRFILSHAGGTLPFLATRIAGSTMATKGHGTNPQKVMQEIRSFYFDTALSTTPAQLKALLEIADHDKITFGSDVPYAPLSGSMQFAKSLEMFAGDSDLLDNINRGNAEKLFERCRN